jgi:hypothetical protein
MMQYFPARTSEWVREKIAALTGFQKKVFDEQIAEGKEERRSLFLALSYPTDLKEKKI